MTCPDDEPQLSAGVALKTCSTCKVPQPLAQFAINRTKRDGLSTICRGCKKAYNAEYQKTRKQQWNPQRSVRRQRVVAENRQRLWAYLREHPCVDCGETDIIVLDFDHQGDKTANVSMMVACGWSWPRIEAEITKCEVVCANDHRRRTAIQQGWGKGSQAVA